MAVAIRMKKMGRTHRPFFRICAIDKRAPRDGRVLEELGTYDPNIHDTDARAQLKSERIDYWISVGAQPSDRVGTLIKKYGTNGTHLDAHQVALEKHRAPKVVPEAGEPASKPVDPAEEAKKAEEAAAAEAAAKAEAEAAAAPAAEAAPAEEAATEAPAEEAKADEPAAEEAKPEEAAEEKKE